MKVRAKTLEIFRDAALRDYPQATLATSRIAALKMVPPAGSGECCEPKLLQYAYQHGYKPLQMAMFWWGRKSEGRDSPSPAVLSSLQWQMQADTALMLPDSVFHSQIAEKHILKSYTKTTSWQSSTSLRDCCLCRARIHPSHPSIPSCGRNIQQQAVR